MIVAGDFNAVLSPEDSNDRTDDATDVQMLHHQYDLFLLTYNSAIMVECTDFPWHSFFLGAMKCFRNHFAYSGFVEV
jgi:hypothetical protein